jgi:CRP-like cAMP-binding protein
LRSEVWKSDARPTLGADTQACTRRVCASLPYRRPPSQIALRVEAESYAPNELIIKPGDPALYMYTIRRGLAAKAGAVMAAGMHFGDDFLLTHYFRPYTVRALTFLDCFRMDRAVLYQLFQYKQFPNFQVRGAAHRQRALGF